MSTLSTFKYAVHLMPIVAAGTFSLNCAYLGIPCIGNANIDTQNICFPDLSMSPNNLYEANLAAEYLVSDDMMRRSLGAKAQNYCKYFLDHTAFVNRITAAMDKVEYVNNNS